jgi:trigger factor
VQVKTENIEKNVVELNVSVEADKFSTAVAQTAKKLAQKINIPGFRKGKAPRRLIEATVGTEALYHETVDRIMEAVYLEAVQESEVEPVAPPEIDFVQMEDGKDFVFKAKITVKPEVDLGEYKGLNIEKEAAVVTPEDIDEELKRGQMQHAKLLTLEEGVVAADDIAVIDFEGFVDDIAFPGGKGEGYELTIGSGSFIPGFEDQLIGAAVGQEKDVNVQFPEEYQSKELAGKKALFKVKVNMIKRKEFAPLDDEFAKDTSDFATLEELKADIREKLTAMAEKKAEDDYQNNIIAKAVENASVEIPPVMIDQRIEQMFSDFEQNLAYQGIDMQGYMQYVNRTESDLREQFRPQAVQMVKTELVIEKISATEEIAVTPEEVEEGLTKMAALYKRDVAVIADMLIQRGEIDHYRQSLINEKTVKLLVDQNRNV